MAGTEPQPPMGTLCSGAASTDGGRAPAKRACTADKASASDTFECGAAYDTRPIDEVPVDVLADDSLAPVLGGEKKEG